MIMVGLGGGVDVSLIAKHFAAIVG